MERQIPIYFDNAIVISSPEPLSSEKNLSRLKVGVFYRYGNRNGSYITDEVANMLINSATKGDTPVIGFFDPQTQGWAGHTGPMLASGYGYVEDFEGWQMMKDTDGVEREYAVFSVILFTKYFKEASMVVGQNQSMELNIDSIQGDWATIDETEYFVYTAAEIMGLCIIGQHEPCFSASSFFEKQNEGYQDQYQKFSSLLSGLKALVEEAEQNVEGGEHQMDNENLQNPEVNPEQESAPVPENNDAPAGTEPTEVTPVEAPAEQEPQEEESNPEQEEENPVAANAEFEARIQELQNSLNEMTVNYENAQTRIAELEAQITSASEVEANLRNEIATYEAEHTRLENENKNSLIDQYAVELSEEEINPIREEMSNFSLAELESKLAVCYAKKHMAGSADNKAVPLPEPVVDEFALLMNKYRKN